MAAFPSKVSSLQSLSIPDVASATSDAHARGCCQCLNAEMDWTGCISMILHSALAISRAKAAVLGSYIFQDYGLSA